MARNACGRSIVGRHSSRMPPARSASAGPVWCCGEEVASNRSFARTRPRSIAPGTGCNCPRGMISKGNTCVEPEHNPRIDVPLGIPGFHGRGGEGGNPLGGQGGVRAAVKAVPVAKAAARAAAVKAVVKAVAVAKAAVRAAEAGAAARLATVPNRFGLKRFALWHFGRACLFGKPASSLGSSPRAGCSGSCFSGRNVCACL